MTLDALRRLDDPNKEQLYREFWAGEHPGMVLVSASHSVRGAPPAIADGPAGDEAFAAHFAAEWARLTQRDWAADDAVPTMMAPICPNGTIATAFGSIYNPALDWTNQCLKRPEQIADLEPPHVGDGLTARFLDGLRFTAAAVGDALPVSYAQVMQGPLSTCSMILDDQVLLEAMYTHPDQVHRLLDMVTDFIIEFAREARGLLPRPVPTSFFDLYFPDGQGIGLSDDLAAVVSPWLYRDFVVPYINRISDAFGGVLLHSCGNPAPVYPAWQGVRGFRGLDIGATEADLTETFRRFSGSAVLVCHVGLNSAPHYGSRLEVVEEILRHVTPECSVLINASSYASNLPAVSTDEWDAESAAIVARVRAHSPGH